MGPNALVFDIETIADINEENRDGIAALAAGREITPEHYAALCPPLARVVCIGWYDFGAGKLGGILDATLAESSPVSIAVAAAEPSAGSLECTLEACAGEAEVLAAFGRRVEAHLRQPRAQLVTYSGRNFDLPVLVHRSIRHGVIAGRALLLKAAQESRFKPLIHVDLLESVTFGGAASRWPLATYAMGYGLRSPKDEMDGSQVAPAVLAGRIVDVMRYCAGDVLATAGIFRRMHGDPTSSVG